jgi:hypothetical protein
MSLKESRDDPRADQVSPGDVHPWTSPSHGSVTVVRVDGWRLDGSRSPLRTGMSQRRGTRREKPPNPTPYAGLTTCLRCDTVFKSWDRRQNRLCERCRQAIAAESSEEPSHPMPKGKGRFREAGDVS